jgi:diguanylate cyclase (GGDEF)-like protein
VLITSAWLITHIAIMPPSTAELLKFAPFVIFGVGLSLSALFHRSRIFHALLVLAVASLSLALGAHRLNAATFELLVKGVALLLPINLILTSYLPESGVFTRSGLGRLGFLAAEAVLLAVACRFYLVKSLAIVDRPFIRWLRLEDFRGFPHSVIAVFALAFLLLLFQVVRRRFRPTDVGIYWTAICSLIALCVARSPELTSTAFAAGAMVLVIALLEVFYAMAYVDELTDLPSRRSFNDAKLRLGNTYTVAMVDVDHFKNFNDTFGHAAGDQVLRMVALKLASVSGGGNVYRYGGEEFAVLFPGKQVDESFPHLERLRKSIEASPFKLRAKERRRMKSRRPRNGQKKVSAKETIVTVSIGVAGSTGERKSPDQMVLAADRALYRAKSCGRNCTIVSETESMKA